MTSNAPIASPSIATASENRERESHNAGISTGGLPRTLTHTTSKVDHEIDPFSEARSRPVESERVDPLEQKLSVLVSNCDVEGIENLVLSIRGVPGHAMIRKNAKKALKRIRVSIDANETSAGGHTESIVATSNCAGTVTPVAQTESHSTMDLLQVVSLTHNKVPSHVASVGASKSRTTNSAPLRTECVLKMSPAIVGWVIGKGGQRIRDLMEESSTRIWIDQDSMGPQEPRVVFVSGQRKNVDAAVRMIQDLVAKAPSGTPQSKQNTPIVDKVHTAAPLNTGKPPVMPDETESPETQSDVRLEPRRIISQRKKQGRAVTSEAETKLVITCDARFVPLLIGEFVGFLFSAVFCWSIVPSQIPRVGLGRRGWTVKHIQDSSLARVDIDQSVTPRRITISGKKEHVEIAAVMVRDILSYPESQLQGSAGDAVGA